MFFVAVLIFCFGMREHFDEIIRTTFNRFVDCLKGNMQIQLNPRSSLQPFLVSMLPPFTESGQLSTVSSVDAPSLH